jgi:hypothetical protein
MNAALQIRDLGRRKIPCLRSSVSRRSAHGMTDSVSTEKPWG